MMFRHLTTCKKSFFIIVALLNLMPGQSWQTAFALDTDGYIETTSTAGAFPPFYKIPTAIGVKTNGWPGVVRAANDLAEDVNRATGQQPQVASRLAPDEKNVAITSTIGKSWMVAAAVVLEKLVVNTGGSKRSYMGPRVSFHK